MKQNYLISAGIFLLSLFLFTIGLSTQEITSFDSRFYLFAEEMWRNGLSWFPTTYNQPYPDYPVTATALIYLFAKLFGGLNKLIAVLPSAIAAAWTVVLTYKIGNLHSRNWGLIAVCFTLMTLMFLKCARGISLDMYVAMFTAWCFYIVSTCHLNLSSRKMRSICPGSIYLLLFLSFAFRGPIGLVIPAGVVCSYYALDREWKKLILFGLGAVLVLMVGTALLLLAAYHVGDNAFMQDVIRMQVAGRIDNSYLPFYFYFTNSFGNYALSYPVAVLVIVSLVKMCFETHAARAPQHEREDIRPEERIARLEGQQAQAVLFKLIAWTLIILIGMSIPGDKKARYVLPMVPAIALIAAYPFAKKIRNFYNVLLIFVIAIALDIAYITVVEPAFLNYDNSAEFVTAIEDLRAKEHAKLVFYREQQDGTPIKYQVYNQQHDVPIFLKTEGELLNYKQPAFFITSEDYFSELPKPVFSYFKIIGRGRVGHVMMIVFQRN